MVFKVGDRIEFTSGALKKLSRSSQSVGEIISVEEDTAPLYEFTVRHTEDHNSKYHLSCVKSSAGEREYHIIELIKFSITDKKKESGTLLWNNEGTFRIMSRGGGKKRKSKKGKRRKSKKKKKSKTRRRRR